MSDHAQQEEACNRGEGRASFSSGGGRGKRNDDEQMSQQTAASMPVSFTDFLIECALVRRLTWTDAGDAAFRDLVIKRGPGDRGSLSVARSTAACSVQGDQRMDGSDWLRFGFVVVFSSRWRRVRG